MDPALPNRDQRMLLAAALHPDVTNDTLTREDVAEIKTRSPKDNLTKEDLERLKKRKNPFSVPMNKLILRAQRATQKVHAQPRRERHREEYKIAASGGGGASYTKETIIQQIGSVMEQLGRSESFYPEVSRRLRLEPFQSLTDLESPVLARVLQLVRRDARSEYRLRRLQGIRE